MNDRSLVARFQRPLYGGELGKASGICRPKAGVGGGHDGDHHLTQGAHRAALIAERQVFLDRTPQPLAVGHRASVPTQSLL